MHVELLCPNCPGRFAAPPETPADEVLGRMADEGPWFALAGGETFEDMVFAAVLRRGCIRCPECGSPVSIQEESMAPPPGGRAPCAR